MARAVHVCARNRKDPVRVHDSSPCARGRSPESLLPLPTFPRRAFSAGAVLGLAWLAVPVPRARALEPGMGDCLPPRIVVALMPLADRTDGVWANWTGVSPAVLVTRLLADSLARGQRREILRLGNQPSRDPGKGCARGLDDDLALRAARHTSAEVVVSGSVEVFARDDQMEPGKFARWGMGAPDARSRVRVSVSLRALDVRDGTVLIETTASRERIGKSVAMIDRTERAASLLDPLFAQALGEVIGDLARTLGQRVVGRWKARVLSERRGVAVLDAGEARGLFAGQRLDVWRPGIDLMDDDLMKLGDDVWVGSVVVTSLSGKGRARARLTEGEVQAGDVVRPCSLSGGPTLSLKTR